MTHNDRDAHIRKWIRKEIVKEQNVKEKWGISILNFSHRS